jgi:1-acyl-sn-glycerol-3-phosphate acyltransferase
VRVKLPSEGPLFPDDGPFAARLGRRARGLALEIIGFVVVTVAFPVLIAGAAIVDLFLWLRRRKHWMAVRLVAMLWWFLFGEMRAVAGLIAIWVLTGGPFGLGSLRRRRLVYALRIHWMRSHLGGVRVLFGLRFEVEGLELAGPGPVVIMMRHASIIDNALPDTLVGRGHGLGLRFVIKRELQMIPTIDIGGRWVPAFFVRRGSTDSAGEIAALRSLVQGMGASEGVLIYPEGTRWTAKKMARAKQIIAERQPELAPLAERLQNLLPPRLGGPLALLDEADGRIDVVFCGHVGFDGFQRVSDIWAGGLVGTTIGVRFWRHASSEIPATEEERIAWLYEHWQVVDDWVGERRAATART